MFSSNSVIEKEETDDGLKKSVKHKITLQIHPQDQMLPDSNAKNSNFDVKFIIKVINLT